MLQKSEVGGSSRVAPRRARCGRSCSPCWAAATSSSLREGGGWRKTRRHRMGEANIGGVGRGGLRRGVFSTHSLTRTHSLQDSQHCCFALRSVFVFVFVPGSLGLWALNSSGRAGDGQWKNNPGSGLRRQRLGLQTNYYSSVRVQSGNRTFCLGGPNFPTSRFL
jgi:hypothetical protein